MQKKPQPPVRLTTLFLAAATVGMAGYVFSQTTQKQPAAPAAGVSQSVPYTEFIARAQNKQIKRIEVLADGKLSGSTPGQPPVLSQQLPSDNLAARLESNIKNGDVTINVEPPAAKPEGSSGGGMMGGNMGLMILLSLAGPALLIGYMMYAGRKAQGGGRGMSTFGKSKARLLDENTNNVKFDDVAGCDEAKAEVEEIVDFLKDPLKYNRLGARIPRGALLVGPPGTGKTLLARATAGEAKVPFFSISGSDFVEMFVGVGAARVRDMFENAKKHSPCIVFIDEIDAVGKQRGGGMSGGNDEREQTLNAMLVEMDGFDANSGVIVMAATNRVDTLDKALLRPGRFDRHVFVGLPDINGREQILKVHARKVPLHSNVELRVLARGTPGMAGADLANLVNESALFAARRNRRKVEMQDFEDAKDKIYMGPERKLAMSEENKRNTAWHESGHAIVGKLVAGNDPVHKVTILPRGQALGLTWTLPDNDSYSLTHRQMLAQIKMFYGGRIAEEMLAGGDKLSISTGASNDIERLTKMARSMVTRFGFHDPEDSSDLVTAFYGANENGQYEINSMEVHNEIGKQIQNVLRKCENEVRELLTSNRTILEQMANDLIEYETIDATDVDMIMKGESIAERKRLERIRQETEGPLNKKTADNDNARVEQKRQAPPAP
jgi:cell division protease FtsH